MRGNLNSRTLHGGSTVAPLSDRHITSKHIANAAE